MFDEEDYYSDEEQNIYQTNKTLPSSKILAPSSNNTDFNHLTADGESLLKMMKQRGIDLTDNEIKKFKVNQRSPDKALKQSKGRSGFFDGGSAATTQQLIKALNKALSKADPQQASVILTHILDKKTISVEDLNKFGVMKCKILFGLGAYKDCEQKAQQLICKAENKMKAAIFSNYLAKCKALNGKVFQGYLDFLRSKALIGQVKMQDKQTETQQSAQKSDQQKKESTQERKRLEMNFKDSQVDSVLREIDYTQLEYNIKLSETKNIIQVLHPHFPQFRHRKIKQIACGDFHAIFLVEGSFDNSQTNLKDQWKTQVFGMGENGVGQVSGSSNNQFFKEPVLIPQLSGKGITGIYAYKETSLAYNGKGEIFEWGVKQERNQKISLTFDVGEQIQSVQKGNKHYALMTKSKKFYTWGIIESRGVPIYKQPKPHMHQSAKIVHYSCGNSCIICVDSNGDAFGLGSNQYNQICIKGENFTKAFKKIPDHIFGKVNKVFCIGDCSFFVNQDQQVYFSGKYSHNKQFCENLKQAQFAQQIKNIINICGHIGCYYMTNETGEIFKWEVDENVKFRLYKENQQITQRYAVQNRGHLFRLKSSIQPQYCTIRQITEKPESYSEIKFQIDLKDRFGLYGVKEFIVSPRCQVHLSTYEMTRNQILQENKDFLEKYKLSTTENRILVNQIVDPKLTSYKISRNQEQPWVYDLDIMVDTAGKYFFYVLLEETLLYSKPLFIQVSIKESQQSEKNLAEKKAKQQERRRKAQQQKKRLLEEKIRKEQEEEQKIKQTQKRAEDALKKHMKEQQQAKNKQMEDRKARKELQTGGGFDLTKLSKRNSSQLKQNQSKIETKPQIPQKTTESFMKSSQSFLPDINARPGSKRKLNIRKDSMDSSKKINILQKAPDLITSSKGFIEFKTKDIKDIGKYPISDVPRVKEMSELNKTTLSQLNKTTISGGKTLIKRGLSKAKK